MSLEAVLSRIDQIQQLQDQLFPAPTSAEITGGVGLSGAAGAAAAASTDGGATGLSATKAAFAAALADAQAAKAAGTVDQTAAPQSTSPLTSADSAAQGTVSAATTPTTLSSDASTVAPTVTTLGSTAADTVAQNDLASVGATGSVTGLAGLADTSAATGLSGTSSAPAAVQSMIGAANSLVGKPYIWGGGHSGWGPSAGYDCSGFVSAVLHSAGYLSSPQDTQTLPNSPGIASGPGQYVTIYDRTDAGSSADHVIIDLAGQFYEAGGESGAWGGGGGVERIATPSATYLASFNQVLHPVGL